jgi:glycosyltransferase involved in cell wall biosynthesis
MRSGPGHASGTSAPPSEQAPREVLPWLSPHKLTIVIPCFNERETLLPVIERVKALDVDKFVLVVDNASTDGTRELLRSVCTGERERPREGGTGSDALWFEGQRILDGDGFTAILQPRNLSKGTGVRLAVALAPSEYVICHDADFEYDPQDILRLLEHAEAIGADAVFGSRLHRGVGVGKGAYQWGRVGLTKLFRLLYGAGISDVATCYKLLRTDVARRLDLRAAGFELDFEIPAKLRRQGVAIAELPIDYRPRGRANGKKIAWHHGLPAVWTMLKWRWLPLAPRLRRSPTKSPR